MRKIRFRAKNADGEWMEGSLITDKCQRTDGKQFDVAFIASGLLHMEQPDDTWIAKMQRVEPATVGQFTSLRDINGKDIYEGDILEVNYAEEEGYLEVRFVRGVFAFLWNGDLDDEFPCNAPTHEWARVVGNIHDNPKMIKRQ